MFRTVGAEAFFKAWQGLREKNEIPHFRTVFDRFQPAVIARLLIFEDTQPDRFIVRFMGTTFLELWREEITGMDVLSMLPAVGRSTAQKNLRAVLDHTCGMRNIGTYATPTGHEVEIEDVFLPLTNDPGKPLRILCFGQELEKINYSKTYGEVRAVGERSWIDLGFGVPAHPPASFH